MLNALDEYHNRNVCSVGLNRRPFILGGAFPFFQPARFYTEFTASFHTQEPILEVASDTEVARGPAAVRDQPTGAVAAGTILRSGWEVALPNRSGIAANDAQIPFEYRHNSHPTFRWKENGPHPTSRFGSRHPTRDSDGAT